MPDTTYQLKVTTANRDFSGNLLKAEILQNFTTKGSPQPISKIPDNTLERWSVRIQPSLTFDQDLDASSIDNKTVLLKPIPSEGYDVQLQEKTIRILPKAPLRDNTTYTVILDKDQIAASIEGILITDNYSFDFKTKLVNKQNYALKFDGADDWIHIEKPGPVGKVPMTYSFWAKTDKNHSMNILSQSCTSGGTESDGRSCKTDLDLKFTTGQLNQEGLSFKNSMHFATAPFEVSDNQWHHYVFVFGANNNFAYNNIKFYVDANLIEASGHGGEVRPRYSTESHNNCQIMAHRELLSEVDEIAIWDQAYFFSAIMNGDPNLIPKVGLLLDFDEGQDQKFLMKKFIILV